MDNENFNELSEKEAYRRTHWPICDERVNPFNDYFCRYGFCSIDCGYENYGLSRRGY